MARKPRWDIDYQPKIHNKAAEELALLGRTDKEIAKVFGLSERAFVDWKQRHQELKSALQAGRVGACVQVAKSLKDAACGFHQKVTEPAKGKQGGTITYNRFFPPNPWAAVRFLAAKDPGVWSVKASEMKGEAINRGEEPEEPKTAGVLAGLSDENLRGLMESIGKGRDLIADERRRRLELTEAEEHAEDSESQRNATG